EELSSILKDEQKDAIVALLDQDELFSLLQEAIVLHVGEEFEESIMYYEDVLSVLNEQEVLEIIDLKEQIKLIQEFKELASKEKNLFKYEEVRDENPSEEENLPIEEAEEVPSNDESVEQEVESTNQEEVPAEKDTMASSVKEKTADPILSEKNIKYEGKLNRAKDGINTKPYGTEGYKTIRLVNDWVGKKIRVTKEAITPRATWAYVQVVGTNVSGWIDKKGLEIDTITSQKDVLYDAKLLRAADGINSKPYGTEGYETNRLVGDLVGQQVRVTKEAVTPRATWAYIEVPETDISGWIDIKGIKLVETILSEKNVKYEVKLTRKDDGINTKPYGVAGYKTDRLVGNLVGKRVTITKEAVTPRASWAYVQVKGTNICGWVGKAGIQEEKIISEKNVNYTAYLTRSTDGINTKPYGAKGYNIIRLVDDLIGSELRVTNEAITSRGTWLHINVVNTYISGWIHKAGTSLGSVAIRMTYYDRSFKDVLDMQIKKGTPKTDMYSGGKKWEDAKKEDVAYYLNPENFSSVNNGTTTKYIDKLQISTEGLNVRTTFPAGTIMGVANRNETYDVLGESNGWYQINFKGKKGWVSGAYVSPISKINYQNEVDNPKMLQFLSLSHPSGISVKDLNK